MAKRRTEDAAAKPPKRKPQKRTKTGGKKPAKKTPPAPGRLANGRFAPGNNANPGGRPKKDVRLTELCRENTEELVRILLQVARDTKSPDRVRAVKELLDRGWGKAPAEMKLTGGLDLRRSVEALSPAERRAEIAALQAQLQGK